MKTAKDFKSEHHFKAELVDANVGAAALTDLNGVYDTTVKPETAVNTALARLHERFIKSIEDLERTRQYVARNERDYIAACKVLDVEPVLPENWRK